MIWFREWWPKKFNLCLKLARINLLGKNIVSLLSGTVEISRKKVKTGTTTTPGINVKLYPLFETSRQCADNLVVSDKGSSVNHNDTLEAINSKNCGEEVSVFGILEELERIACIHLDGAQTFAAANLPTLLIECMALLSQRDSDHPPRSYSPPSLGLESCGSNGELTNLPDCEDEIYDDYQLTDDENEFNPSRETEAQAVLASPDNDLDSDDQQSALGGKSRYRRSDVVASRLRALCCALVGHKSVMLSLIREPEFGLVKVFRLVTWSLEKKLSTLSTDGEVAAFSLSAGLAVLKAMSSEELVLPLMEFVCEHKLIYGLVEVMIQMCKAKLVSAEQLEDVSRSLLEVLRVIIGLLRCSCRDSTILLEDFEASRGFELFHIMICAFPNRVAELLPELVNLLCFGPGFREAEAEAAVIGAIHPILKVRNIRAFSVVSHLVCQLCLSEYLAPAPEVVESVLSKYLDEKLSYSKVSIPSISDSLAYAWSIIETAGNVKTSTQEDDSNKRHLSVEGLELEHRVKNFDSLRLPLLHCILNIYSSNPSNFGILDEKFGVMSSLVLSLGSRTSFVRDEFLFMVIKLVELVAMGMDYKPSHILKSLCMVTLPQIVARVYLAQSLDYLELENPTDQHRTRRQSLCLDESARYYQKESSFIAKPESQGGFLMEVLCNTLNKLVKSDDEYKNTLRNDGLLSLSLFPFIRLAAESLCEEGTF